MKKQSRDTIQNVQREMQREDAATLGRMRLRKKHGVFGQSERRAKHSAQQCVIVFSIAAVLTMLFLQGCGVKHPENVFGDVDQSNAKSALRIQTAPPGSFVPTQNVSASQVNIQLFSNGCSVAGTAAGTPQLDPRLIQGDWITETFHDALIGGTQRNFTLDQRVESNDPTSHTLRAYGRLQNPEGTTEFTKQCQTQATTTAATPDSSVTPTSTSLVSCTNSPTVDSDESEPCTFNPGDSVSRAAVPGQYQRSGASATDKISAFFLTEVNQGDLTCPNGKIYVGVTRTAIKVVSNDVPTLDVNLCGGTVLFQSISYEDKSKHVYYNSTREVKLHARFN